MEIQFLQAEENTHQINLEQMTCSISEELQSKAAKQLIHQALVDILPNYKNSRIWSFVPILMRREVTDFLRQREPR